MVRTDRSQTPGSTIHLDKSAGQPILDGHRQVERLAQALGRQAAAQQRRTVEHVDRLVCQTATAQVGWSVPNQGPSSRRRPQPAHPGAGRCNGSAAPRHARSSSSRISGCAAERWSGEKGFGWRCRAGRHKWPVAVTAGGLLPPSGELAPPCGGPWPTSCAERSVSVIDGIIPNFP